MPTTTATAAARTVIFDNQGSWKGFANNGTGADGAWANSIFPGVNRSLNPGVEGEYYCDPNAGGYNPFSIEKDESLLITASPEPINGFAYSSGALVSPFSFLYGLVSVEVFVQDGVSGFWPAVWMLPTNEQYTCEADIMELFGKDGVPQQTLHGWVGPALPAAGGSWQSNYVKPAFTANAKAPTRHVVGMSWNKKKTSFFLDGVRTATFPTPLGMNTPMSMILNLAVGSGDGWIEAPNEGAVGTFGVGRVRVVQIGD